MIVLASPSPAGLGDMSVGNHNLRLAGPPLPMPWFHGQDGHHPEHEIGDYDRGDFSSVPLPCGIDHIFGSEMPFGSARRWSLGDGHHPRSFGFRPPPPPPPPHGRGGALGMFGHAPNQAGPHGGPHRGPHAGPHGAGRHRRPHGGSHPGPHGGPPRPDRGSHHGPDDLERSLHCDPHGEDAQGGPHQSHHPHRASHRGPKDPERSLHAGPHGGPPHSHHGPHHSAEGAERSLHDGSHGEPPHPHPHRGHHHGPEHPKRSPKGGPPPPHRGPHHSPDKLERRPHGGPHGRSPHRHRGTERSPDNPERGLHGASQGKPHGDHHHGAHHGPHRRHGPHLRPHRAGHRGFYRGLHHPGDCLCKPMDNLDHDLDNRFIRTARRCPCVQRSLSSPDAIRNFDESIWRLLMAVPLAETPDDFEMHSLDSFRSSEPVLTLENSGGESSSHTSSESNATSEQTPQAQRNVEKFKQLTLTT